VGVTGESIPISRTCIPLLLLASQLDRKGRIKWTKKGLRSFSIFAGLLENFPYVARYMFLLIYV